MQPPLIIGIFEYIIMITLTLVLFFYMYVHTLESTLPRNELLCQLIGGLGSIQNEGLAPMAVEKIKILGGRFGATS